jgi:ferredoxin/flavodoxin---NADP+ reductase
MTANADAQNAYNATVIGREEINPLLLILRVQPDDSLFDFKPGQFAVLGLLGREPRVPEAASEETAPDPAKMIRRAYSIASSSVERRYVEIYLTLITSGQLTPRLFALKHGSRLFLGPKASGVFTLDRAAPGKAVVLIATGTGLAPYISMLRTMLVSDTQRRFVVLHGARYGWDLGYRGELESLTRLRPNFTYIPSITRPDEDPHFQGHTGRVQTLLEQGVVEKESGITLDPAQADVFLCGNPDMVTAVKAILEAKGFKAGFECGRTELMRNKLGMSYAALEAKGIFLPLVEAHLEFQSGARYDDLLRITSAVEFSGRARLRFEVQIDQCESGKAVVRGYTVHAFTDGRGRPVRPPSWFVEMLQRAPL